MPRCPYTPGTFASNPTCLQSFTRCITALNNPANPFHLGLVRSFLFLLILESFKRTNHFCRSSTQHLKCLTKDTALRLVHRSRAERSQAGRERGDISVEQTGSRQAGRLLGRGRSGVRVNERGRPRRALAFRRRFVWVRVPGACVSACTLVGTFDFQRPSGSAVRFAGQGTTGRLSALGSVRTTVCLTME